MYQHHNSPYRRCVDVVFGRKRTEEESALSVTGPLSSDSSKESGVSHGEVGWYSGHLPVSCFFFPNGELAMRGVE